MGITDWFRYFNTPEVDEAYEVVARMGEVFIDFELYSSKRFLGHAHILPLRPRNIEVVGGSLLIELDTNLLPRGVFVEQLSDPRLMTALKTATGRHVEFRYSLEESTGQDVFFQQKAPMAKRTFFSKTPIRSGFPFYYKVELDTGMLRGIPRYVEVDDLPGPDPDHYLSWPIGIVRGGAYFSDFPSEIITMLVCGATRQGKSTYIRSCLNYLKEHYHESYYKLVIADFKDDKTDYRHLIGDDNVFFFDAVSPLLDHIQSDNKRRAYLRRQSNTFNIFEHNDTASTTQDIPFIPYQIVIIDELYLFSMFANREHKKLFQTLVATTASNGIYWLIGTQRPATDIIDGSTKANFVARMAFSVATEVDGSVIFGNPDMAKMPVQLGCPGRGFVLISDQFLEFQSAYS